MYARTDRAGLAWSDAPSSPLTFTRLVDEFAAVIAHITDRKRCVLVGHSFGSWIVRTYASRHPEGVVGLVLVDPPTEWLVMTPHRARLLRGGRYLSRIGALLARLGVVRACLAFLGATRSRGTWLLHKTLWSAAHVRSSDWSAKCASCRRMFNRSCRHCGVNQNAFTPWRATCWHSNETALQSLGSICRKRSR